MKLFFAKQRPPLSWSLMLILTVLTLWFCLRLILWSNVAGQVDFIDLIRALLAGVWFDVWTLAYLFAPILLLTAIMPIRVRTWKYYTTAKWVFFWIFTAAIIFGIVSEYIFWEEFTTRFNFIAVDYLIYTHEVIGNIQESYPVPLLLLAIAVVSGAITLSLRAYIPLKQTSLNTIQRKLLILAAIALPVFSYSFADIDQAELTTNVYANEIATNGLFSLASAMRHNELDYDRFYQTIPNSEARKILINLGVRVSNSEFGKTSNSAEHFELENKYFLRTPKNIVLISVESLSAKYVGAYGATTGLTPNIDKLASEGLQFDRMLATGTRTVRGLEALSLGTPPIPGQAILRRPQNAHLSSMGEILYAQGFDTYFIYGGYGYFDNMNNYFRNNHYQVFDRMDFKSESIAHENIWGVDDESLYANSLNIIDKGLKSGAPFFAHIMTTSNHRPFTFPEGRIDLPQGSRASAVKYSDYAIGEFFRQVKSKPWFNDTLFVIVADHNASVAGKTKLPVAKYHIPMILYGPKLLKPGHFTPLVSQIDVAPTLLHAVADKQDHHYEEADQHFYGQPLLSSKPVTERAFVSNYQQLGYYKNNLLIVLSPKKRAEAFVIDPKNFEATQTEINPELLKEAIAWYQMSAKEYKMGMLQEHE